MPVLLGRGLVWAAPAKLVLPLPGPLPLLAVPRLEVLAALGFLYESWVLSKFCRIDNCLRSCLVVWLVLFGILNSSNELLAEVRGGSLALA